MFVCLQRVGLGVTCQWQRGCGASPMHCHHHHLPAFSSPISCPTLAASVFLINIIIIRHYFHDNHLFWHTPPSLFAITCHSTTASPWTTEWWLELDRISVVSDPNQFVCFQVNFFLISDHRKPRKQDAVMVLLRTANAIFWWKLE